MTDNSKYMKLRNWSFLRMCGEQLAMGRFPYDKVFEGAKLDCRLSAEKKIHEGMSEAAIEAAEKAEDMSLPFVPDHKSVYDWYIENNWGSEYYY